MSSPVCDPRPCSAQGLLLLHAAAELKAMLWHVQILGSRTSSAAAYEDALSHGFTPETTASLLDFDTPMASPTSPGAHQARA